MIMSRDELGGEIFVIHNDLGAPHHASAQERERAKTQIFRGDEILPEG